VRVGNVERSIGEGKLVRAALMVVKVVETSGRRVSPGKGQSLAREVKADDFPRGEPLRQPQGDAPGPAADIEKSHPGPQLGQEERRRLIGRAPRVLAQRRRGIPVCVLLTPESLARHKSYLFPSPIR
jgi:hypothetical protein